MVCDFFFPRLGGVEMHIWSQAQCLMAMGHKVIVVTNAHGSRRGVRWMTNGLKVYYIPLLPFVDGSSLPTLGLVYFPLFRRILIREGVNIVHSHQVPQQHPVDASTCSVGGSAACPELTVRCVMVDAMHHASGRGRVD